MTPEVFIRAIQTVVTRSSVNGVLENILHPPGRKPPPELVEISKWFAGLDDNSRKKVKEVMELVASQSTYNFLLVLDDLLTLESTDQKGRIEIFYRKGSTQIWLNSPASEPLTSLFKALNNVREP
jgi:hypothetical protein